MDRQLLAVSVAVFSFNASPAGSITFVFSISSHFFIFSDFQRTFRCIKTRIFNVPILDDCLFVMKRVPSCVCIRVCICALQQDST